MKIQKLRDMNLGAVADELEELRAFKAEIESQEPFRWALDHLDFGIGTTLFDSEHGAIDFSRHLSCSSKAMPLYAKPVPPKQPSRITDEMISRATNVVIGYSGDYGTHNDYLTKKSAREVLEAALSVSGQVPAVAVPDDACKHGVKLPHECGECQDGVDSQTAVAWYAYESVASILEPHIERAENPGGFLPDNIQASVQILLDHYLAAAPSHSQQSADTDRLREFADEIKQLCSDFSDRQNRPYMGDVTAAIDGLYEQFNRCPSQESKPDKEFNPRHNCATDCAVAAIEYALANDEPVTFLRLWMHGEFDALRKEWDNIPDAVFIGADTLFKPTLDNEREQGGAV